VDLAFKAPNPDLSGAPTSFRHPASAFLCALFGGGNRLGRLCYNRIMARALAREIDLWSLVLDQSQIDPDDLAMAIEREAQKESLDFRTRLLIRDSIESLRHVWGEQRTSAWLQQTPAADTINSIANGDLGPPGFSLLSRRIMPATRSETIIAFLRELGLSIAQPEKIVIGGAASLILTTPLSRRTEDIDVVDELPARMRTRHDLLDNLAKRYGIRLIHFQSHYLPLGWELRTQSLGRFGQLDVWLVDRHDTWLGKLFSPREKDRDDLRLVAPVLDKSILQQRLAHDCAAFFAQPDLRRPASDNWYIVFGETLPA